MRNPKWHRDEIILALDLYFKLASGKIHASNQQVIDLSNTINKLPIFDVKPDAEKFRNANGVSLKLSNFLAIDDSHTGKGMSSYSKLDQQIFNEFKDDRLGLSDIADSIRKTVENPALRQYLWQIEDDGNETVKEGQVLYKLHKYRERNSKIVCKKKAFILKNFGKLECEICGFDFYKQYGGIGYGFIECHHKVPLSTLASTTETSVDDLMMVCANCHRMLHRKSFSGDLTIIHF